MWEFEAMYQDQGLNLIAGVDEVGRGALAGPVIAAAVILPVNAKLEGVRDSKALSKRARASAFDTIGEVAVATGIGYSYPDEIDRINVLQGTLLAMERAVANLGFIPELLLIDGRHALGAAPCPQRTVVRGDARSASIAAASIVAKVTRDRLMRALHDEHPHYGWATNVGYPTAGHYAALRTVGPSEHHRRSFRLS